MNDNKIFTMPPMASKYIIRNKLEYYKLSSVLSWLQLINGVFPKCVYIKHNSCGKVECEPIGYMNISDIKKISKDINIKLVIK